MAGDGVHLVPVLPGSITTAVGRSGWLEDWRLAAALLAVAAVVAAGWTVAAVRGRRAGRRPPHPLVRRVGLACLIAVLTLAGGGAAVNSYAGYAPDLPTLARSVPQLLGGGPAGGAPVLSGPAGAGSRPRLVALTLSDPGNRIPPGRTWVYLPAGYDDRANARHRYPVVYLIHGHPGGSYDWFGAARAARTATLMQQDRLVAPMILVGVDATGGTLADTECLNSTTGGPRLETFLTRTVVAAVDHRFRTLADPSGRAIGGASSGGYCALNLGLRHQDTFRVVLGFLPYGDPGGNAVQGMLGGDRSLASHNSPAEYARTIPLDPRLAVFVAAGRDDPATWATVRTVGEALAARGVYVGLHVDAGLGHTWREVRAEFPYALAFASAHLSSHPTRVVAAGTGVPPPLTQVLPSRRQPAGGVTARPGGG